MNHIFQLVGLLSALCVVAAEEDDHDRVHRALTEGLTPEQTDVLAQAVQDFLLRNNNAVAMELAHVLAPLCHRSRSVRDAEAKRQREYDAVARLDAQRQMRWLRAQTLGYAAMCATCGLLGVEWPDGADEIVGAVVREGARIGLAEDSARQAGAAIWCEGSDIAQRFHDSLRRRIWLLCAGRAPGMQIVAAADAVHERFGRMLIDQDGLIEECRRVAAQTSRRRRHAAR
jgi:hypothetical protein